MEVFLKIVQKPRSFTELLKETHLKSPKSLSNHLKSLKSNGMIERAIIKDREVYKLKIFDSQKIVKELETDLLFPFLATEIVSFFVPDLRGRVDEILTEMATNIIKKGQEALTKEKGDEQHETCTSENFKGVEDN